MTACGSTANVGAVIAIAPAYRAGLLGILLLAPVLAALATLGLVGLPAGAATGDTERVSVNSFGFQADDGSSETRSHIAASGDGRFVLRD